MRRLLPLLLLLLAPVAPAAAQPFSFAAFGDVPYCRPWAPRECVEQEARVADLMQDLNRANPAFTVHVGDTIGGSELCTDEKLLRAFAFFTLANHPLVYTPGDNEWTDCWRDFAGRYAPQERLAFLRARYFRDASSLGRRPMPLLRQADVDPAHPALVENARWVRNAVVFATLHVTGSNNGRPGIPGDTPVVPQAPGAMAEYEARHAANLAWLEATFADATRAAAPAVVVMVQADLFYVARCGRGYDSGYADFRSALARHAAAFGRPVLLVHGDSHFWLHDRPIATAPNLTRIMVPGDQDVRAVMVAVDPSAAEPWSFTFIGRDDRMARPGC